MPAVPVPVADDPWQVNGPMARSALDVAAMLDALSGFSADYPLSVPSAPVFAEVQAYDVRGRRFGYCPDVARIGVDPEIERLCQAAVRDLEHAGAIVEPIDLDLSPGREAFLAMRGLWVVGQQYERLDDLSVFGVNVANNIRLGLGITVKDLARADHVRGENWRRLSAILRTHDALLTPCVPVEPFPADRNYPTEIAGKPMSTYIDWIAPTFLFSMMGVPAASVPAGLSKAGLPVGLQIIGPRFHEGACSASPTLWSACARSAAPPSRRERRLSRAGTAISDLAGFAEIGCGPAADVATGPQASMGTGLSVVAAQHLELGRDPHGRPRGTDQRQVLLRRTTVSPKSFSSRIVTVRQRCVLPVTRRPSST